MTSFLYFLIHDLCSVQIGESIPLIITFTVIQAIVMHKWDSSPIGAFISGSKAYFSASGTIKLISHFLYKTVSKQQWIAILRLKCWFMQAVEIALSSLYMMQHPNSGLNSAFLCVWLLTIYIHTVYRELIVFVKVLCGCTSSVPKLQTERWWADLNNHEFQALSLPPPPPPLCGKWMVEYSDCEGGGALAGWWLGSRRITVV